MVKDNAFYDQGKNMLYDSWEIVRLYGLYEDDGLELEPEGRTYNDIIISPWEGRTVRINMEK